MTTYYVLYVECDGDVPTASVHLSIAEAEAELRKFAAEEFFAGRPLPADADLLDALLHHPRLVVDCRIYKCTGHNAKSDWVLPFGEAASKLKGDAA